MTDYQIAAIDCGAGTLKMKFGRRGAKCYSSPSLISRVPESAAIVGAEKVYNDDVFALSQDGKETWYYAGDAVKARKLPSDDVFSDPMLKASNALLLVLAGLVQGLGLNKGGKGCEYTVYAVASHHDPVGFGGRLRAALVGTHQIRSGNLVHRITIEMPLNAVFAEGSAIGAVFGADGAGEFAVLDLGYLTALYSLRSSNGAPITTQAIPYGVGRLVEMLQSSSALATMLGGVQPDRDVLIASLIEAARTQGDKLRYRAKGRCHDITAIYKAALKLWLKGAAQAAVTATAEREGTGFQVVAIGGGVNLPFVAGVLVKKGINIYGRIGDEEDGLSDPLYANAETLFRRCRPELMELAKAAGVEADAEE